MNQAISSLVVIGQVGLPKRWGNGARGARQGSFRGRGVPMKDQRSSGRGGLRSSEKPTRLEGCKLCKANGSPNFKSHEIADCWLLNEKERSQECGARIKRIPTSLNMPKKSSNFRSTFIMILNDQDLGQQRCKWPQNLGHERCQWPPGVNKKQEYN